jgi:hypothetical protein
MEAKHEARMAASCERARSGRAHARSFRLNHHCRRELTPLSSTPRLICASTSAERRDRRVGSTGVFFLNPDLRLCLLNLDATGDAVVSGAAGTTVAAIYGNDMFVRGQLLTAVHIEDLNCDALFLRCLRHCASPP